MPGLVSTWNRGGKVPCCQEGGRSAEAGHRTLVIRNRPEVSILKSGTSSSYGFELCFFPELKAYCFGVHFSPVKDAGVQARCTIGERRSAGVTRRRGHCSPSFFPLITAPGGILHSPSASSLSAPPRRCQAVTDAYVSF